MSRLLVLVATLAAGCGPIFTVHTRTSPQRVTVTKHASPPALELSGRFVGPTTVELVAKHARDVRVTRVVHYGAASFEATRYHWLAEILEAPVGLLFLLLPPLWETPPIIKETDATKFELHSNWLIGAANPFQNAVIYNVRAIPGSNVNVFAMRPATREFRVSLPAHGLTLVYRAFDDAERVLASGTVQTDGFGRATVPDVGGAIALEITIANTTTVVPVDPQEAAIDPTPAVSP